jgi:hypothetical protein
VRRPPAALVVALLLAGCGGTPAAAPGKARVAPDGPRVARELEPTELFPADLDLVVRLDVGRMRAGLGPAVTDQLSKRALQGAGEPELAEALACADVVWIATRAAEVESGDRVIVIEGKSCMPELGRGRWEKVRSTNARVAVFDRHGEAARSGTARIVNLGNHATVFVSPVELDSVKRVLDDGPDDKRGSPTAEGLVSVDLRARALPPGLAKRFPAIAAVLGGIERIKGSAVLGDEGLKIDAQVMGKAAPGAERAAKFLEAMRDSLTEGRFAEAAKGAKIELVERTVQVKLTVPARALLSAMSGDEKAK